VILIDVLLTLPSLSNITMLTIILLTLALPAWTQNNLSFQQYLSGLGDTLKANGMNIVSNALGSVNGSVSGAALLDTLFRGNGFTFFAPVDSVCPHPINSDADEKAWDGLNLTGVTDDDLVDVLSYHVRPRHRSAVDRSPQQR
jgi:hypothetical protein